MAYLAEVKNFSEVQEGYEKVKEANLAAAHIPCRYRLFHPNFSTKQDYADDGDHNIGREILQTFKHEGVFNVAVYIVRYYDGEHIGPIRFKIVKQLTQQVLSQVKHALNYGQNEADQVLVKAFKQTVQQGKSTPAPRGQIRSGGRGWGGYQAGHGQGACKT